MFLIAAAILAAAGGAVYVSRATTLTIAVAPAGGTEPVLLKAFAETLAARGQDIRLKLLPFDGVRESAEALRIGGADLAVVRPDVAMPDNGLTLAILREQALIVVAPEAAGIKALTDLAGKRLGFIAQRVSDRTLFTDLIAREGLRVLDGPQAPPDGLALVGIEEADIDDALAGKRIDALALLTTPTSPAAGRIVASVRGVSEGGRVTLAGVPDAAAIVERMPKLQAVTVRAGLFGSSPKVPEEDLSTVGASYRLMARSGLSRSVAASVTQYLFEMRAGLAEAHPAANAIKAPAYESNAEATSARLPIHPGALDYFEREQESFIERYETWIYLLAFLGGGIGSVFAWLRQRLSRVRRERIEEATERLLDIRAEAQAAAEPERLEALAGEIDELAAEIARFALNRHTEARTMSAATIAIDAARATVERAAGLRR